MKKNKMMRIASVLLVAVLLSTCAISGTFAKYVTEVSADDTARVAAWGFGNTTSIDFELFSTSYNSGKINSSNTDKVIAPGASQTEVVKLNYANTTGKNAPEVAYTIDLNIVTATIGENIENNVNIVWSFNGTTFDHTGGTSSWDKMIEAIEAYHEDVAANNLPALTTANIEIGWAWKLEVDDAGNAADTALGDAATLETVVIEIKLIAKQVG